MSSGQAADHPRPLLGQPPVLPHPAHGHEATGREAPAPRGQPGRVVAAICQALWQPGEVDTCRLFPGGVAQKPWTHMSKALGSKLS